MCQKYPRTPRTFATQIGRAIGMPNPGPLPHNELKSYLFTRPMATTRGRPPEKVLLNIHVAVLTGTDRCVCFFLSLRAATGEPCSLLEITNILEASLTRQICWLANGFRPKVEQALLMQMVCGAACVDDPENHRRKEVYAQHFGQYEHHGALLTAKIHPYTP